MKTLTVVLVVTVLVIHISGYLIQVPTEPIIQHKETASRQWLHFQKMIMPLFENVCEVSSDPLVIRFSQEFTLDSGDYLKPEALTNFQKLKLAGFLSKGEIFTEYNPNHMDELKIIYELLYYAKDVGTFYKAASWARQNLNCALYVDAIYLAIQNRRDTERLIIPAPYELLPNYFIEKDVIKQASSILTGHEVTPTESIRDEGNAYHIDANYTAIFYDNEDDSKLAYFREDIGLNAYYYLRKLRMGTWSNDDINGENMYQMMKQFMARYDLERYANGLPEIDSIDWNSLPDIPYDPMLIYSDGNEFCHRTSLFDLPVNEDITLLQTIESNIVTVVDHMRQSGNNKTLIMNHLMEILVTGDRSYETLARQLLGKDITDNRHVSVLEHYMTSLRDPMFWKINKKIVDLIDRALKTLPTYTRNELYFPGVSVVNIEVKKMMTTFDYFEFDVTDALKIDDSNTPFNIKIGQPRLNNKPFTVKLNISSLVSKKGLVKIYLGPKLMPGELATKKNLFTLLDVFEVTLKIGTNIISRTSDDMKQFSADFMSLKDIRKKVEDAEYGLDSLPLKMISSQIGYPARLILPKGTAQGLPLQMFVFVAPFTKASLGGSYSTSSMEFNSAILSPGYPLDLVIESKQLFELPNALIKYVTVMQKKDSKVENYGGPGVTKQWYGTNTYDPSSRPSYSANNGKSFDYNSKKRPYESTDSDTEKVNEYNVASLDDVDEENGNEVLITKHYLQNSAKFDYSSELESKNFKSNEKKEAFDEEALAKEENNDTENGNKLPRLLKSSKYDFSSKSKSKEQFDYKAKKAEFDKKINSAKSKNYYKYSSDIPLEGHTVINDEIDSSLVDVSLLNPIEFVNVPLDYKYDKAKSDKKELLAKKIKDALTYPTVAPPTDNVIYNEENLMKNPLSKPLLLKSASYDYSSKYNRKEPFDYKTKKAEFDKKDYSAKRGNYTKYRKVKPEEEDEEKVTAAPTTTTIESADEFARVVLNKDTNYLNLIDDITANDFNAKETEEINDVDIDLSNLIGEEPLKPEMVRKRIPTVYDFLFNVFNYDDSPEIKVYE